jgi:hypothetical protein
MLKMCRVVSPVDRRFRGGYGFHQQCGDGGTSETSVYSDDTTRRYIPEGSAAVRT